MSELVLVKEVKENEVIFSTSCFDGSYASSEGTRIVVKLSSFGTDHPPVPVFLGDWLQWIDAAIDVVKGCLKISAFIFPAAAVVLIPLAQAGTVVQAVMQFIPDDRPDEVVEKLKVFERTIHKVEMDMHAKFTDMLSFITESEFTYDIVTEVSVLMRLMKNCLTRLDAESRFNFKEAYDKKSPLSLAYKMISLLEQKSTNPLMMAMAVEKNKTKETFEKWENIISGILGELILIEAFASGLLENNDSYDYDRLKERTEEVEAAIRKWEEGYDLGCWAEIRLLMDSYASNHTHLTNQQKAEDLKKRLDAYSTKDAYYIVISNRCVWGKQFFNSPDDGKVIAGSSGTGECMVFIYRSRNGNKKTDEDYKELTDAVEACRDNVLTCEKEFGLRDMVKTFLNDNKRISPDGLMCIVDSDQDVHVLSSHCPGREWGPGWWINANVKGTNGQKDSRKMFLVAFP